MKNFIHIKKSEGIGLRQNALHFSGIRWALAKVPKQSVLPIKSKLPAFLLSALALQDLTGCVSFQNFQEWRVNSPSFKHLDKMFHQDILSSVLMIWRPELVGIASGVLMLLFWTKFTTLKIIKPNALKPYSARKG